MKRLIVTLLFVLLPQPQSCPTTTNIPIQTPSDLNGYGSVSSQDLGVNPKSIEVLPPPGYFTEGTYRLTFSVVNQLPHYPGYFTAKLSFGTQELCEASGWGKSVLEQVTVVCPMSAHILIDNSEPGGGPPQGSKNLVVTWSVDVWPLFFTKGPPVSLTFTTTQTN